MAEASPPGSFESKMIVPKSEYRTAIAIKHDQRMAEVAVTFMLREQLGSSARYAALCPRCKRGEIVVDVELTPDMNFRETPACPSLCLDCEDRLDSVLEPESAPRPADGLGDREALSAHLKAMNSRSWD